MACGRALVLAGCLVTSTLLGGPVAAVAGRAQAMEPQASPSASSFQLSVTSAGGGSGGLTSSPAGISCPATCTANFSSGTKVKLSATAGSGSFFAGWAGACTGSGACSVTLTADESVTATFNVSQTVEVLNHIIFLAQENRGLDHYFGALRAYWKANGFADRSFDGLPQFNPVSGLAPLYGPPQIGRAHV
jgi:phospholipase C